MPGRRASACLASRCTRRSAAFGDDDLERTGRLLDAFPAPRTIVLQWVPHGYGRRGMNLRFATWMARRAAAGDRLDVMVHEPFVDYLGGSWIQPVRAVVQRSMTRAVLRAAQRVWLSIPGWEERLLSMLPPATTARVLPVPGTIPVDRDPAAVAAARARVIGGARFVVGYFGTGGPYVDRALAHTIARDSRDAARCRVRPDWTRHQRVGGAIERADRHRLDRSSSRRGPFALPPGM